MEPHHVVITVLTVAALYASNAAWKAWLNHRLAVREKELDSEERDSESKARIAMSELEYRKLELLARSQAQIPMTKEFSDGADDFRNDSLNKLKPADTFEIPRSNFEVDGETAAEITNSPRERSVDVRMDGEFFIQSVSSGETRGYKLKVKRAIDGK